MRADLPVARGVLLSARSRTSPALDYYLFVPGEAKPDAPLFVAVHGYSRTAREQAERFAPWCEKTGHVLLAPHFDAERFPDFQRLGRRGRGERADLALDALIRSLRAPLGMLLGRLRLFGYSGGAQFVHRYLMAYPHRLDAAVVAASGWFTFPDATRPYPFGIRVGARLPGVQMLPETFLRVPVLVAVGERDADEEGENLRHTPELDRQQGVSRLERGMRWTEAMNDLSKLLGFPARVRFTTLPNAGHSFEQCIAAGLARRAFEHFGACLLSPLPVRSSE